jgi:guanosine-3',5'-bis(diphosphate) 3'-pyrophosphohydrolase
LITLQEIVSELLQHHPDADQELVRRAYVFAARSHRGQTRKSGEPYIMHPLEVALLVAQLNLDAPSVCAGLLHDTVEDTEATLDDIRYQFGDEVSGLVESLTKLNKINFQNQEEAQAANFRKMLIAMSRDLRVILIKLSDRLHNMRTLGNLSLEKRQRISRETMDIYAPLASRLGLYGLKVEMEDLCFKHLFPEEYTAVARMIQQTRAERHGYIEQVTSQLQERLLESELAAEVSGRPKHLWSIRQKLKRMGDSLDAGFDSLYDILAFRIIVDRSSACYEALGLIHSLWKPIPGRFKDYIALPKQNGYQSLHTAVFGPGSERIEVQIRTHEMHRAAELGVAAHWIYKEQGQQSKRRKQPMSPDETFVWLRQLLEWQRDLKDPSDFMQAVRVDLFDEEVYVFTPGGEVKPLPRGATPIDLAYEIHTDLGNECTGARVNGKMVSLRYELQNGDVVEIIRTRGSQPKLDWLKFAKTGRATTKIRAFHRTKANEQSFEVGQELLDRELRRLQTSLGRFRKEGLMEQLVQRRRVHSERELLIDIGYGKLDARRVLAPMFPEAEELSAEGELTVETFEVGPPSGEHAARQGREAIMVDGEDGIAVHYPNCCSPVSGDEIVGFVTLGRGVTIHRADCPNRFDYDPACRVPVGWNKTKSPARPVDLRIYSDDTTGLLASMSQVFHAAGVNISAVNCQTSEDKRAVNDFTIMVQDLAQLTHVIKQIKQIKGIKEVERLTR